MTVQWLGGSRYDRLERCCRPPMTQCASIRPVSVRAPGILRPAQQAVHRHSSDYRGDIDGLRAVAVTLVVLFHVGLSVLPGGFVGVDVFYVISGFLITGLLVRELRSSGTVSITNFYARRVRRLLPLSALVLVTTAIASRFLAPVLDRPGIGSDIRAAAMYVANWHYASASTQYMASTGKSPVLHYWSLSVEEQFYVLWPLLLLLVSIGAARRSWQVGFRRIAVTLGALGAASFALSVVTTTASGPFAFFGLHTRAWEMAVGAGLALATDRWLRWPALWSTSLGWIGLLMILASAGLLTGDTPYPGSAAALPVLGTAMLLASGAAQTSWSVGRLLSLPPVRYLGRTPRLVSLALALPGPPRWRGSRLRRGRRRPECRRGGRDAARAGHRGLSRSLSPQPPLRRESRTPYRVAVALHRAMTDVGVILTGVSVLAAFVSFPPSLPPRGATHTACPSRRPYRLAQTTQMFRAAATRASTRRRLRTTASSAIRTATGPSFSWATPTLVTGSRHTGPSRATVDGSSTSGGSRAAPRWTR